LHASEQPLRWRLVEMRKITDHRGNLTAIEGRRDVAFDIARVYYIYDVPSGSVRAGHAHKRLHQVFVALSGSFVIHLDDSQRQQNFMLNRPHIGLHVEPGVWRMIDDFSGGAVCMVLASDHYDEADYLRTREEFELYVLHSRGNAGKGLV
jgi:dTDP-4-dehydrorhamnose 3,5-epimerase-like enzyme